MQIPLHVISISLDKRVIFLDKTSFKRPHITQTHPKSMTPVHHTEMTIKVSDVEGKGCRLQIYVSKAKHRIKTHHIKPVVVG